MGNTVKINKYLKYIKEYIIRLLLILLSFLISIVLTEIFLRVFSPILYSMEVEYIPDAHLRHRLASNRTYILKSGDKCSINNLGFRRDGDVQCIKPPGVFRIVVLGGSAAFSYQTDDKKTWPSLLEMKLKNTYNYQIEVLNGGVPGYSVFTSKINYLYRIRYMKPDAVIVYHTWNDMKYFKALERGVILDKGAYRIDRMKSYLRHFQIAWRIRNIYHEYILPRQRENLYSDSIKSNIKFISDNGKAHQWERKNYEDLALIQKSDKILPIFATQASLLSIDNIENPTVRSKVYTEYQGLSFSQILEQWQAISKIITAVAKEKGAVLVDVYSQCPHNLNYFYDHVHLTEMGNQKVADIIFEKLKNDLQFNSFFKRRTSYP